MISEILTDKLNFISNKSSLVLDEVIKNGSALDDYVIGSFMRSLKANVTIWLASHPVIAWLCSHPIISLVIALLSFVFTLRLLATIYRAIAQTIDRMWLWILRSPWLLLKFLLGWEVKPPAINSPTTVTSYEVTNSSVQLQSILERLDAVQNQQQQIIQELAELKQKPLAVELRQIKLIEEQTGTKPASNESTSIATAET